MVRTHPDPPLVCDNRRMTALSHRLHTQKYAAQCSALSCLVLADQWAELVAVKAQIRIRSMGFEKQAVQGVKLRRIAEAMQAVEQRRNAPLIEAQRRGD